jgi:hypothetical protein
VLPSLGRESVPDLLTIGNVLTRRVGRRRWRRARSNHLMFVGSRGNDQLLVIPNLTLSPKRLRKLKKFGRRGLQRRELSQITLRVRKNTDNPKRRRIGISLNTPLWRSSHLKKIAGKFRPNQSLKDRL